LFDDKNVFIKIIKYQRQKKFNNLELIMNNNTFKKIEYRPTLTGRIARVIIPMLNVIFPKFIYNFLYSFLYYSYKKIIKYIYLLKVMWWSVFGDYEKKYKTRLTYLLLSYTMGGPKALENAFDIVIAVEKKKLEGAIVECGVAEGGTSAMMAMTNRKFGVIHRDKWLFDSFEGLPEPTKEDYVGDKTGKFIRPLQKGSCLGTVQQVKELMFNTLKFSKDEIHLVKGWFQKTLPVSKKKISKIAVLRLDGDWYESTIVSLTNLFDLVVTAGYVIVDDYATCYGSKKALDEFLESRGLKIILNEDGRGGVWFEKTI
jgi:hypothetical protein